MGMFDRAVLRPCPAPGARRRRQPGRGERGVVLVLVLWVLTLMIIMAASFSYDLRTETRLAQRSVEQAKVQALAEAGLYYAALQVLGRRSQPPIEEQFPTDGTPVSWRFGEGTALIRVRDSSGRVDLNRARRELLEGLLLSVGVDPERVEGLLDAIEDWRDPDDFRRPYGAEAEDYRDAEMPPPKNGPFESVEELQQVIGVDADLYRRVVNLLTVHSSKPGINPAVASRQVLQAIPDLDPEIVADYLRLRAESRQQGLPPPPLPEVGGFATQGQGLAFHVQVEGVLDSGTRTRFEAIITRGRRANQLYHILSWREGPFLLAADQTAEADSAAELTELYEGDN